MADQERTLRVEAVVLRHSDWGEADRLLGLYTREAGKLRAVAKGVRRLRSRKAGHLEPFTRVKLLLARGRDLWIVTQAETVDAYLPLREDLEKIGQASYVLELLDRFSFEEGANRSLYALLTDTLGRLSSGADRYLTLRYFELHLLDYVGYRPELSNCVRCGEKIEPADQFFSVALGGVVCPRCGALEGGLRPLSLPALRYLRHVQRSNYGEAQRVRLAVPAARAELEQTMQAYLTYQLERGLNSPDFLREIQRKGSGRAV